MALWGGRFSQGADSRFKQFNDSLRFDYRLAEQDIQGSMAWAKALVKVGVLTEGEQGKLQQAMEVLLASVQQDPQQILNSDAEDIHSWVESQLIAAVGDLMRELEAGYRDVAHGLATAAVSALPLDRQILAVLHRTALEVDDIRRHVDVALAKAVTVADVQGEAPGTLRMARYSTY